MPREMYSVVDKYTVKKGKLLEFIPGTDAILIIDRSESGLTSGTEFIFKGYVFGNRVIVFNDIVYVANNDIIYSLKPEFIKTLNAYVKNCIVEPISKSPWSIADFVDTIKWNTHLDSN